MSFSRFQLGFTRHRKIFGLSADAFRLWVSSVDFARDQKTDGVIMTRDLPLIPHVPNGRRRDVLIAELVDSGLWETNGSGWLIHDFLDWQDSAVQANERSRRARERMRDVRANRTRTDSERSREVRDGPSDLSSPDPDSDLSRALPDLDQTGAREEQKPDPVFTYWAEKLWKKSHPDSKREAVATPKRLAKIRARRREGFTDSQLCEVIDRVAKSPFHLGENGTGRAYIEPETIFHDREKVDGWLAARPESAPRGNTRAGDLLPFLHDRIARLEAEEEAGNQ